MNIEIERPLKDNEEVIDLNPVQFYAAQESVKAEGFIPIANEEIKKALIRKTFWSDELKYPGFFTEYCPEKDEKGNIAIFIVNSFMSLIVYGVLDDVMTVGHLRKIAPDLIQQPQLDEEAEDSKNTEWHDIAQQMGKLSEKIDKARFEVPEGVKDATDKELQDIAQQMGEVGEKMDKVLFPD